MKSGRTTPSAHQFMSAHIEVRQGKHGFELVIVFGHASIAGLGKAKLPLDDSEGVFHFGPDAGLGLLQ